MLLRLRCAARLAAFGYVFVSTPRRLHHLVVSAGLWINEPVAKLYRSILHQQRHLIRFEFVVAPVRWNDLSIGLIGPIFFHKTTVARNIVRLSFQNGRT